MLSYSQQDALREYFLLSYSTLLTVFFGLSRPTELLNIMQLSFVVAVLGLIMRDDSKPCYEHPCLQAPMWPNDCRFEQCCEESEDDAEDDTEDSTDVSSVEAEQTQEKPVEQTQEQPVEQT